MSALGNLFSEMSSFFGYLRQKCGKSVIFQEIFTLFRVKKLLNIRKFAYICGGFLPRRACKFGTVSVGQEGG